MSSPRDPDGDPHGDPLEDRRDDGSGWQEPAHLGGEPNSARDEPGAEPEPAPAGWQPPGWDLPAVEPARPERTTGAYREVFSDETDVVGAQGWALQQGWSFSDGVGPQDLALAELVASAPLQRLSKDHRPGNVLRGRAGTLDLVAFDVVYESGRYLLPQYAITAAPMLGSVPRFRLSPARLWKHRTGGLIPIPSGNEMFDLRWVLLAAEDSPQLHRLAQDPAVQQLLLGSDDGDEFWSAAGFVATVRPDGHRSQLIEHHSRLLAAVVRALGAG
jgi:hypothetical protein